MSEELKLFFLNFVIKPFQAWTDDEKCEWKAMAVANGINALVEHAFQSSNPSIPAGSDEYKLKFGNFRRSLRTAEYHDHVRAVAEVFKHGELIRKTSPSRFTEMRIRDAGAFSNDFSDDFDVVRPQIGFPFEAVDGLDTWVTLRSVVEECIQEWRERLQ